MSAIAVRVPVERPEPAALEAWVDDAGNLVIPAAALREDRPGHARVVVGHGDRAGRDLESLERFGLLGVAVAATLLVGVIAMFAAHGRQWAWTGFAGSTSLWSWLHLLVQPIALAFITVRLLSGAPLRLGRTVGLIGAALVALLVLAGYSLDWTWTGFPGKALWDWLSLMLFPVVVVLLPEWVRRGEPFGPRARAGAAAAAVAFAVLVVGGYRLGWTWTGFTGNTFLDWLNLMIAPLLLPVALKVVHTLHVVRAVSRGAGLGAEHLVEIPVSQG